MIGSAEMWNNLLHYQYPWFYPIGPRQSIDIAREALDPGSLHIDWGEAVESTAGKIINCCFLFTLFLVTFVYIFHSCLSTGDFPLPKTLPSLDTIESAYRYIRRTAR